MAPKGWLQKTWSTEGSARPSLRATLWDALLAGIVMSGWMAIVDLIEGRGLWRTPELIGTIALGPPSYRGGRRLRLRPVTAGFLLHEGASGLLGAAHWACLRLRPARRHPAVTGVGVALGSW